MCGQGLNANDGNIRNPPHWHSRDSTLTPRGNLTRYRNNAHWQQDDAGTLSLSLSLSLSTIIEQKKEHILPVQLPRQTFPCPWRSRACTSVRCSPSDERRSAMRTYVTVSEVSSPGLTNVDDSKSRSRWERKSRFTAPSVPASVVAGLAGPSPYSRPPESEWGPHAWDGIGQHLVW